MTRPVPVLAVDLGHLVLEQILDANSARGGVERLHQAVAGRHGGAVVRVCRRAGLDQWPVHRGAMQRAQHRVADRGAAAAVRRPVDEHDAVREQELDSGGAVVGKSADDLAVVVAIVREAVRLHHRPVGQVVEDEVGKILDAVLLLDAGAAAERQVAATDTGMAADMGLCLDDDHRRAGFLGNDRGRESAGARADDDDVGLPMPLDRPLLRIRNGSSAACGQCHGAAREQQVASVYRHEVLPC